MSVERNTELYLPASASEVRQFTHRLDRLWERSTQCDGAHFEIEINRRVRLGDGSVQLIEFEGEGEEIENAKGGFDSLDNYAVSLLRAVPVDDLLDSPLVQALIEFDQTNLESLVGAREDRLDGQEDDEGGYLELEKRLKIARLGRKSLQASISSNYNIYDNDFEIIETIIGFSPAVEAIDEDDEIKDLNMLAYAGIPVLDATWYEQQQTRVTRADLILFTNALIGGGLLHPRTIAYDGAPQDVDGVTVFKLLDELEPYEDD